MNNCKKIKVAQIIGNAVSGGVPSFAMNYFRNIDKNNVEFIFYTYAPAPIDEEILSLGGKIIYMPDVRNIFKCISFLKKSFRENNLDIVHSHMTTLSLTPLYAAKLAGIKTRICHAHSTTNKCEKTYIIKTFLKPFARIFATHLAGCSHLSMNWLFGKKKGSTATLIPNAIDLSLFTPDLSRAEKLKQGLNLKDKYLVGNIGRFEYQKNHIFLIESFRKTLNLIPKAMLILVGSGKREALIKEKIDKMGLSEHVIILPENNEVYRYYELFNIFWLPSLYEGLPLVGIEAQSMNIPCIMSNEISKEADVSGSSLFLPINDSDLWAQATIDIFNFPIETNNKPIIRAKGYDIKHAAPLLLEYYNSIVLDVKKLN